MIFNFSETNRLFNRWKNRKSHLGFWAWAELWALTGFTSSFFLSTETVEKFVSFLQFD